METSMSKLCRHQYDEPLLDQIFTAYTLLDKCDEFFENLNMSVMSCVNVTASETLISVAVNSFVLAEGLTSNTKENLAKVNSYIDDLKRKEFQSLFSVK